MTERNTIWHRLRLAALATVLVMAVSVLASLMTAPGGLAQAPARIDLDEAFACREPGVEGRAFCDRAREIIIRGCGVCHNFLQIIARRNVPEAWVATVRRMRPNALITDEEAELIERYLGRNLTPDVPLPPSIRALN